MRLDRTLIPKLHSPSYFFSPIQSPAANKKLNKIQTNNKIPSIPSLSPIIMNVAATRPALVVHIYISIQGGLAILNWTSRRKSFSGLFSSRQALRWAPTQNYAKLAQTLRGRRRVSGNSVEVSALRHRVWKCSKPTPDMNRMRCSYTHWTAFLICPSKVAATCPTTYQSTGSSCRKTKHVNFLGMLEWCGSLFFFSGFCGSTSITNHTSQKWSVQLEIPL